MITSLDIEYQPQTSVVIVNDSNISIDIVNQPATTFELSLVNAGPTGPKGDKGDKGDTGDSGLNGYTVEITNPQQDDIIQFQAVGSKFVNQRQYGITDGGNF